MTKKILSLVISLAMILPMLAVTSSASVVLTEAEITDMNILQTYETDVEAFAGGKGTFEVVSESGNENNNVLEVDAAENTSHVMLTAKNTGIEDLDKFTLEFDVKKLYASAPIWVGLTHPQYGKYGMIFFPGAFLDMQLMNPSASQSASNMGTLKPGKVVNPGTWSNVRITVDRAKIDNELKFYGDQGYYFNYPTSGPITSFKEPGGGSLNVATMNSRAVNKIMLYVTVEVRDEADGNWIKLENFAGASYSYKKGVRFNTGTPVFPASVSDSDIAITVQRGGSWYEAVALPNENGVYEMVGGKALWQLDNFRLYNADAVSTLSSVTFADGSGTKVNTIPDGEVTANIEVSNFANIGSADAVMVAYDKDNQVVAKEVSNVSLGDGFTVASISMDVSSVYEQIADGGRIEAYLWKSIEEMTSFGSIYGVLGAKAATESSETTALLAEESNGKTYRFTAVDRSTSVNTITVEGKHDSGESVPVTLKIEGKTSGEAIVLNQFMTTADGSFKKSFVINPEFCSADTSAVVTLSGIDTTCASFEIPVSDNWDDMVNDFLAFDADSVEEYYDTYKDNLSYYAAGETDITSVDVDALTAEDFEDIAFVKSNRTYDEMTYADVVYETKALIDILANVDEFESDFADALALETEAEKIEAIKALITDETIFTFSTEGVSNIDAICKALTASVAETIQEIFADFENAYQVQKSAEESTVPGFTSISSGAEMKQFFADNEIVLGVNPEKYTDEDYDVMYTIYEEKAYSDLTSYEAVNEAIVFLDKYINEYNQFMGWIRDAATVSKNYETIKTLLNHSYSYVEIDLVDETAVVNKAYLYKRLIDMDCTSLWTIEDAFENAVNAQYAYEIAAKDAFNTIIDAASIKAFFAEYADMIGVPETKNYTDADLEVFAEVYANFASAAADYSETITATNDLIAKNKVALKLIADINVKSTNADWQAIKSLYEGEVSTEYLNISTDTSEISDIRSMYQRIANEAPYATLAALISAWNNAYQDQQDYEAIAGGYETFDDEKFYFEELEWDVTVSGNVITIKGKVNENGLHQLALYVEDEDNHPIYLKQIVTEVRGNFEFTFILNPDKYDAEKQATLRIGGDGVNVYTFAPFELYSAEELETIIDEFMSINNKNDVKTFLDNYSEALEISVDTDDDRVIEALYFLYNKDKEEGLYDDIADIDEVLNGVDGKSGTATLMATMERMIQCLEDLTEAANEKVGSGVGRWKNIKTQVQLALSEGWINPDVSGKISSESSMYLKMSGIEYGYMSEVEDAYENAHDAQFEEEKKKPTTGGGGGGGGSSSSPNTGSGSDGKVTTGSGSSLESDPDELVIGSDYYTKENVNIELNKDDHPESPFKDVTAEYSWAQENINDLRKFGLVRGDGNGNFRPGDGISREEFLTILLNVFAIERKTNLTTPFVDVDKNAWYYDTVATAYDMGIVKGYSDTVFGIGDTISRADMAVLICRTMEYANMDLDPVNEAFVFGDFTDIPDYAYQSVAKLQQAGVLNGDTFGNYNPLNNVTRAESAVALWAVFDRTKDFVYYSWEKVY